MGKRISIELTGLLGNTNIDVTLRTQDHMSEDGEGLRAVTDAVVVFSSRGCTNPPKGLPAVGIEHFILDVESFQGSITLSTDFNLYGDTWWPLMAHLHNNSIPYRVI